MASKTTNDRVEALRAKHRAERRALDLLAEAEQAVQRAREHRAAQLARLDETVAQTQRGHDVALAVLAAMMSEDAAASVAGVDVAALRAARKRVDAGEVRAVVGDLGTANARRGRRGGVRVDRVARARDGAGQRPDSTARGSGT